MPAELLHAGMPRSFKLTRQISINASCSLDEIMAARTEGQKVMFQIYLNKDRSASEALLKKVTDLGAAAIMFTVDTPYRSKRTMDVRAKVPAKKIEVGRQLTSESRCVEGEMKGGWVLIRQSPIKDTHDAGKDDKPSAAPLGVSQAISGYQDTNLTWKDIAFIRVSISPTRSLARDPYGARWADSAAEEHTSTYHRQGYPEYRGCAALC
jgi:L-lactate dehydrogenase (cytochrome)